MEIFPKDLLLRVGGATLHRFGLLAVAGSRRGPVELPLTFARADAATCATYIDRDGMVRVAEANKLRREWVDLDGDGVRESPGLLLEGSRINLVENGNYEADAVGSASQLSTIARDSTQAKFGSWALKVTTTNAAFSGVIWQTRAGARMAASAATAYALSTWVYAPAASVGKIIYMSMDWYNAGAGLISTSDNQGTPFTLVAGWQRLTFAATSPALTVTVDTRLRTTAIEGVFDFWCDLVQFEAGAFMSSAIPTGTVAVTRAADSLALPFNFGPMDLTVLARLARPVWADAVGTLGFFPGIADIGNHVTPKARIYQENTSRNFTADISAAASSTGSRANPAGASITMAAQFKNFATGGQAALDVGAGQSAFGAAATALTAFGSQTLRVGGVLGSANELYGVLLDLVIARDLRSLAEMAAIA